MGKKNTSLKQTDNNHRRSMNRNEGIDPPRLEGRERPNRDETGEDQGNHDGKGQPSLRQARRQGGEDKTLFLWDSRRRLVHWAEPRRGTHGINLFYFAAVHMIPVRPI